MKRIVAIQIVVIACLMANIIYDDIRIVRLKDAAQNAWECGTERDYSVVPARYYVVIRGDRFEVQESEVIGFESVMLAAHLRGAIGLKCPPISITNMLPNSINACNLGIHGWGKWTNDPASENWHNSPGGPYVLQKRTCTNCGLIESAFHK